MDPTAEPLCSCTHSAVTIFIIPHSKQNFKCFCKKILFFLQILRFEKRDSESDNKNRKSVLDKPDFFWYTNSNKTETALFPL
ncbi:MAG TPA: hypothetical protein DCM18_05455 [Ruminococcus sp.]|nr:hypothetical protein [Ruminococcus sp.]